VNSNDLRENIYHVLSFVTNIINRLLTYSVYSIMLNIGVTQTIYACFATAQVCQTVLQWTKSI